MNDITLIALITAAVCVISAAAYAFSVRRRTRKLLKNIHDMLDSAIEGTFTETKFDESVTSSLESKVWQYLSSSEISARKTAEEKDKIKTLIADISHQTKTPISNIALYSELLCEQELPDEAGDFARKISIQSEKLRFLITSLVKLSRLETGIISLKPKKCNISPMLEGIADTYIGKAKEKGLAFTLENADINAVFDEKWTAEAIGNIVDNAIKYTDSGKINISVRQYEMFVRIDISDTGRGISEEYHSKIFGRFFRLESSADSGGVGIGLYLAREIVSGESGYIKVSSEKGKGSVFSVFIPR